MANANFAFNRLGLVEAVLRRPAVVSWNRLEPRPRTENFERSLRVEVRDALWMLTRQWQFGEFKGDDAGSATIVQLVVETASISHVARGDGAAEPYDAVLPLEAWVEREPAPVDVRLRVEKGVHWLRLLRRFGVSDAGQAIFRGRYAMAAPSRPTAATVTGEEAAELSNSDLQRWRAAVAGRALDGEQLYRDLIAGGPGTAAAVTHNGQAVPAADAPAVGQAEAAFLGWCDTIFSEPAGSSAPAWDSARLEYRVACAIPRPGSSGAFDVLSADEYARGNLDWHDFDKLPGARLEGLPAGDGAGEAVEPHATALVAAPLRFAGMPAARWWEFEDGATDLGEIRPDRTDIAKLLLAEFALLYGNDWLAVPLTLSVGSLSAITGLVVGDVFGQRTLVEPTAAPNTPIDRRWTMFSLSERSGGLDPRLFLPPTLPRSLESAPLEKVLFARDETTNTVWAIEATVPNGLGSGVDGSQAGALLREWLRQLGAAAGGAVSSPLAETDAEISYLLGNTVPEHWIPFLPERISGQRRSVQLRRGRMLRLIAGLEANPDPSIKTVRPRGRILVPEPGSPYRLNEEEVPRAGAVVSRAYQRARWLDGRVFLWVGRRKETGRGESSSGLRFDQIDPAP